jgi:hypothetical protein
MRRGIVQRASDFAGYWPQRMMWLTCIMGLALLSYCGVQNGANLNSQENPPTTLPSGSLAGMTAVFDLASDSQVVLEGATNASDWSSSSSQAHARVMLDVDDATLRTILDKLRSTVPPGDPLQLPPGRPAFAEISMPVMSLKGSSPGMDRDMHAALQAQQHPSIQYRLEKVQDAQLRPDPRTGAPEILLHVVGTLTVAGVQKTVAMEMTIHRSADNHYLVHAQTPIRMTDFGVTPPTALFGLIRAHDALSVIFNLDFVRADAPAARPPDKTTELPPG